MNGQAFFIIQPHTQKHIQRFPTTICLFALYSMQIPASFIISITLFIKVLSVLKGRFSFKDWESQNTISSRLHDQIDR